MGEVIELPTQLNLIQGFRDGSRIKAKHVDGSIMMEVDKVELWLGFEEAATLCEDLGDAIADCFSKLHADMEEMNNERE